MSDQPPSSLDASPIWLKRGLIIFVAIFLFRVISFWLVLLFSYLQDATILFVVYAAPLYEIVLPATSIGIAVLIGLWLEKLLLKRKKTTNIVFLVLFVLFALTPLDTVTNIRFLFEDELTKELNEYIENAGTILPVSIEYRAVLSEPDGSAPYTLKDTEETLYLSDQVVIDETHFVRVYYVEPAIVGEGFNIGLELNEEGTEKMWAFSKANIDKRLAIVIDGELVKAPHIRSALHGHISISNLSKEQAFDVTARLESMIGE